MVTSLGDNEGRANMEAHEGFLGIVMSSFLARVGRVFTSLLF